MRMRALLPLTAMLALSACGDSYKPVDVYMAATPECKDWQEGSRFDLPRGISVSTTPPVTLEGGGAEFTFVYFVPRGQRARFLSRDYNVTAPRGAVIAKAELVTFYQRAINSRACLLYTSPSPRDGLLSRMPSSA